MTTGETTASELLARYVQHLRRRHLAAHSIITYRAQLTAYTRAVDPLTATTEEIEMWLDGRRIGDKSRLCYVAGISGFHRWMVDKDVRTDDPSARVVRPQIARRLPRPIATGDLERAMDHADTQMLVWLCLAAYGGLRCCEIANLRVEDVALDDVPPMLHLTVTKGGDDRSIPIADATADALRVHGLPATGPLFPGALDKLGGGPMGAAAYVSGEINTYLRSEGIKATAHQLRHWFGTRLYDRTRDIRLVQHLLGHADISTTAGYVALVPDQAAVEAVAAMSVRP